MLRRSRKAPGRSNPGRTACRTVMDFESLTMYVCMLLNSIFSVKYDNDNIKGRRAGLAGLLFVYPVSTYK